MSSAREVVISGIGVVSPIGIGSDLFWRSLCDGQSGVRHLTAFDTSGSPTTFGAEVVDFDPKEYVRPRKSLKVMSRDIQFAVTAADLACKDARLDPPALDPNRFGVVFGSDMIQCQPQDVAPAFARCFEDGEFDFRKWGGAAMAEVFPLWMLRYLPNMPACHIAIAHDARGPNNTHCLAEASSLTAVAEAARVIQRGHADVMIAGGTGCRIHPTLWVRCALMEVSRKNDDPPAASKPFDRERDGLVNGEGAAVFILESRGHAQARGARVWGRIAGFGASFEALDTQGWLDGAGTRRAIVAALRNASLGPGDIGHVNAHGLSTRRDDRAEARAIHAELGDVPVTAPKSFFGNIGSGGGAVEMAASVLAFDADVVPATLNFEIPDPECPVNVVHGHALNGALPAAVLLNQTFSGQSVALVVTKS